jgi:YD repeat-containing protein
VASLQAPTIYAYDQFDRQISQLAPPPVLAPANGPIPQPTELTQYGYDANGNQTSVMTPVQSAKGAAGKASTSTFDGLNEQVTATDADGNESLFAYDPAGNQTSVTRPNGQAAGANPAAFTTVNTFDPDNRLTKTVDGIPGALQATIYGYDKDGNETSSSQVRDAKCDPCASTDGCAQTTTTFDGRDLPWSATLGSTSSDSRTTVTEYDQNGDLRRSVENAGVNPSTGLPYQRGRSRRVRVARPRLAAPPGDRSAGPAAVRTG